MRPAASDQKYQGFSYAPSPGNPPGQWVQGTQRPQQFAGSEASMHYPNSTTGFGNVPRSNFPPAQQTSQLDFRGTPLPSFSFVPVQTPSMPFNLHQNMNWNNSNNGVGTTVSVRPVGLEGSNQPMDSIEERKRIAQQRQQAKMRESFQASKNKSLNPDDLMGKIIADFGPITPAKTAPDRGEVQSRPITPIESPTLNLQRDRSGSLNLSPQSSARLCEPASEPTPDFSRAHNRTVAEQQQKVPDISDLMMKFSDLSSTNSTKPIFTAPHPKMQPPVSSAKPPAVFFNNSQSAVDWSSLSSDLTSAFTTTVPTGTVGAAHSPSQSDLPPWCSDVNSLSPVYRSVLQHFKNQPSVAKSAVMGLLSRSGLGYATLDHIWSVSCRTQSDVLSRSELCAALGLVGLAQTNFDIQHLTIDVLRRIPSPPEPSFMASTPVAQPIQPVGPVHQTVHPPWPMERSLSREFQNIPLSTPALQKQPSVSSNHAEDEEFADFVSAAAAPVIINNNNSIFKSLSTDISLPKPQAHESTVKARKQSDSTADPGGWGDWAQQPPTKTATESHPNTNTDKASATAAPFQFRPEMVGRRALSSQPAWESSQPVMPAPSASTPALSLPLPPITAEKFTTAPIDPYAALRDLAPAAVDVPLTSKPAILMENFSLDQPTTTTLTSRRGSGQTQSANLFLSTGVDSPRTGTSSGDEISLQSLEFGVSSADLPRVTSEETLSNATTAYADSLVLESLDFRGGMGVDVGAVEMDSDFIVESELTHAEVWTRTLEMCSKLLKEACTVFNSVDSSAMLTKVITKAHDHIQNLVEVYRVARRVYIGARSTGLIDDEGIIEAIKETEKAWTDFTTFLSVAGIELPPGSMDFTKADISANHPDLSSVCGVCLLDVDAKSRSRRNTMDGCKIEQEGRFYHSACANFWVNCVDPKLPRLTYINIS